MLFSTPKHLLANIEVWEIETSKKVADLVKGICVEQREHFVV